MYRIYDRANDIWVEMNYKRALTNLKNNPNRYLTKAMKEALEEVERLEAMSWEDILNESKI